MYLCVRGIDFSSFYDVAIGVWRTVVFLLFCLSCYVLVQTGNLCVICVCLRTVVTSTYCVVFLFRSSSSCVLYVASFSGLSFLLPLRYSLTFMFLCYIMICMINEFQIALNCYLILHISNLPYIEYFPVTFCTVE